jgi:hypothetical protein
VQYCHYLFFRLDPLKLMDAGDTLPDGDSFNVYRGVAGTGAKRRVRGYSWTGDVAIATMFAELRAHRYGLPNPAVFRATVRRQDILAYVNESGRNEQEFLIRPDRLSHIARLRDWKPEDKGPRRA